MLKVFSKAGFTLIELLLVMAIIGVLSTLALAIVNDAQFDANANATRSRISIAHVILRQKLESYARRRLPVDLAGLDLRKRREYRHRIISDIVNVEMPRRFQNIAFQTDAPPVMLNTMREAIYPSQAFLAGVRNDNDLDSTQMNAIVNDLVLAGSTAFGSRFKLSADPIDSTNTYPENGATYSVADVTFDPTNVNTFPSKAARTTNSEYLYNILETANFNGISAIESMGDRSFADTDGDGFLEFVDSWGSPICFQFEVDTNDDGVADAFGLDPGMNGPGIAIRNIRIRLLSTGNGIETITN